jgi:hypothetical protein
MLKFQIFITIFIAICSVCSSNLYHQPELSYSNAVIEVIREFYIANSIRFDFVIYGQATSHLSDVIDAVSREISKEVAGKIIHIKDVSSFNHKFNQSAVIFMKSSENLRDLNNQSIAFKSPTTKLSNIPERYKFLVFVEEIQNHQQICDALANFSIPRPVLMSDLRFFEFFLTSDKKFVNLTANLLYSEEKCGIFTQKLLNSYDIKSQKWTKELRNYNHFENLNDCLLTFGVRMEKHWYVKELRQFFGALPSSDVIDSMFQIASSKNLKSYGLISELVELMAQKSNFSYHYSLLLDLQQGSAVMGTKNYAPATSGIITFLGGSMSSRSTIHWTNSFGSIDYYYLVTLNDLYSNYEKLLFPFDAVTWCLLLMTFGLTFGIIFGLHGCPRWIRTVIFGSGLF